MPELNVHFALGRHRPRIRRTATQIMKPDELVHPSRRINGCSCDRILAFLRQSFGLPFVPPFGSPMSRSGEQYAKRRR